MPATSAPTPTRFRASIAYLLEDRALSAVIVPELGGKIVRLVDRATGRDWLWENPALPHGSKGPASDEAADAYVVGHDTGGFDECFPAIAPGAWAGTRIPDHGVLWSRPWEAAIDGPALRLEVDAAPFPVRFSRTAMLRDGALRLDYALENLADTVFPFIWSAHPLLGTGPGMKVELPVGHPCSVYGESDLEAGLSVAWPNVGGRDLSLVAFEARWHAKIVARAPSDGRVAVADPASGRRLVFSFDPAEVPHLGLWLNHQSWAGLPGAPPYANLAIEPAIGMGDDLTAAIAAREAGQLPALGRHTWHLTLHFEDLDR